MPFRSFLLPLALATLVTLSTGRAEHEIEAEVLYSVTGNFGTFGKIGIVSLGDVDGDGEPDFAIGETGRGFNAGRVRFYSGRDGSHMFASPPTTFWSHPGGLGSAGDLTGDGIPEVLAWNSSPDDPPVSLSVFDGSDGARIRSHNRSFSGGQNNRFQDPVLLRPFDFDGDGTNDYGFKVRISERLPSGFRARNEIYMFSGATGAPLSVLTVSVTSGAGASVNGIGDDLDGDGHWDVVATHLRGGESTTNFGLKGPISGPVLYLDRVRPERTLWRKENLFSSYRETTIVEDITGDGVRDVVADPEVGGLNGPRLVLMSGADGETAWNVRPPSPDTDRLSHPYSVNVGDVDGDGVPELAVPDEPSCCVGPFPRLHLVSGANGRVLAYATSPNPDDGFGRNLEAIGDLNRDGISEIAVASGNGSLDATPPGKVHVISFRVHREPTVDELAGFRLLKQGGQLLLTWNAGLPGATLEKSTDLVEWETVNDVAIDGVYFVPVGTEPAAYYRLRFQR